MTAPDPARLHQSIRQLEGDGGMHPYGSQLRVVRDLTAEEQGVWDYRRGDLVLVEEPVPLDHPENDMGVAYYLADNENCSGGAILADAVELAATPEQVAARKIPESYEIARAVGSELLMDHDRFGFEINDSETIGATVEVYGRTHDGLPFGAHIVVKSVWRTDS